MEAKVIELSTLLRVSFKKTDISKQLNVSRSTILPMEQRLKASKSLKIVLDQEDLRLYYIPKSH